MKSYIRRLPEELFDLEVNPGEVNNLADDPAHAELLRQFRDRMEAWQRETRDPWLYWDGISVRAVEHHLSNGLTLPERFDFDPSEPKLNQVSKWAFAPKTGS